MSATVRDLTIFLATYIPDELPLQRLVYLLGFISTFYPVIELHRAQISRRRRTETGWLKRLKALVVDAFFPHEHNPEKFAPYEIDLGVANDVYGDVLTICDMLQLAKTLDVERPHLMVTKHRTCSKCADDDTVTTLRSRDKLVVNQLIKADYTSVQAYLLVAHCPRCKANFYPDRVTYVDIANGRRETLEADADYLRVSKNGVWAERSLALHQEKAVMRLKSTWKTFHEYINDISGKKIMTYRQSQRLFTEHFGRRLLVFHGRMDGFHMPAFPNTKEMAEHLRNAIGKNSGYIKSAFEHGCQECTHRKRYRSDLIREGMQLAESVDEVADADDVPNREPAAPNARVQGVPEGMPQRPQQQEEPGEGEARGYVRMAVMDGKTVSHRICAMSECRKPLVNYRNGRFCQEHLGMAEICGIIPCGRPVENGSLTCDQADHRTWHEGYRSRFARLTYPGVRRVIRRQRLQVEDGIAPVNNGPALQVNIPALGDTPGNEVVHTFRARKINCVITLQWACGTPIGWGKCYDSESSPQVLAILNKIWANADDELRPGLLAYDDACDLLRHIVTQNRDDIWVLTTTFIVDAWHYIGHKATDALCRLWCNPAPKNGSQPDLIIAKEDAQGATHITRAFNTITAEQLNSWLTGYEAPLRQMSDVNFDFYIHSLLMLFYENIQKEIIKKELTLPEDFFDDI